MENLDFSKFDIVHLTGITPALSESCREMAETLNQKAKRIDHDSAAKLLSGKNGFICQYDRKTGKDTVWSVIYDLTNNKIYRTEGNPSRRKFKEDTRFHILK